MNYINIYCWRKIYQFIYVWRQKHSNVFNWREIYLKKNLSNYTFGDKYIWRQIYQQIYLKRFLSMNLRPRSSVAPHPLRLAVREYHHQSKWWWQRWHKYCQKDPFDVQGVLLESKKAEMYVTHWWTLPLLGRNIFWPFLCSNITK